MLCFRKCGSRIQSCGFKDFRHGTLPLDGLYMNAFHSRDFEHLLDQLNRDFYSLGFLRRFCFLFIVTRSLLRLEHTLYQSLGHTHSCNRRIHIAEHHRCPGDDNPAQDCCMLVNAEIPYLLHLKLEHFNIINALGLDKVSSCIDLFLQAIWTIVHWLASWSKGCSYEEFGGDFKLVAAFLQRLVAHFLKYADKLDGIDIINVFRSGVAFKLSCRTKRLVITGNAEAIFYPQRSGTQKVGLYSNAVAVPASHLHDRLKPFPHCQYSSSYAGNAHHGSLAIGYICRIAIAFKQICFFDHFMRIGTHRRAKLSRYCRVPARDDSFKVASTLHIINSSD